LAIRHEVVLALRKTLLYGIKRAEAIVAGARPAPPEGPPIQMGEFRVPQRLAYLTGPPENLGRYRESQFAAIQRALDLRPEHCVFEIGCGIGRLATVATQYLRPPGRFFAMDIIPDSIAWCAENITPRYSNFHFWCEDIQSDIQYARYQPLMTGG
jgi:SAM-dependent methyltransferase